MTGLSIARLASILKNIPLFAETVGVHHKNNQRPTIYPKATNDIPVNSLSLVPQNTSLQGDAPQMADMTTYEMLDDVNLAIEAAHVTAKTHAIAGYVNGRLANWPAVVAKWGRANKFLLSIDVQGNPSVGAQCLDCEKGDVDPSNHGLIVSWVKATRANGVRAKDLRFYPKVYTSVSNAEGIVEALTAAGVARDTYMLWTAHYGQGAHICGPSTCGSKVQADATQYTSSDDGVSLDASLCFGYFFAGANDSVPPVPEAPKPKLGTVAVGDMHVYASYRGAALDWATVPEAEEYDVQLLSDGTEVGRTKTKAAKTAFRVHPSTDYAWRVAALPGGEWSAEASFKTPAPPAPEAPVTAPVAPSAPTVPVTASGGPTAPVDPVATPVAVEVPQPAEEPVEAPSGSKGVLVYVQEILDAALAAKLGLPDGTILFIPHTVEGA